MQRLLKLRLVAAFAGLLLLAGALPLPAQQASEVDRLADQARELRKAGKSAQAIQLLQRIVTIEERRLGPAHPSLATWLSNLAVSYIDLDRNVEAEPFARRALAIREEALGPNHLDVAAVAVVTSGNPTVSVIENPGDNDAINAKPRQTCREGSP